MRKQVEQDNTWTALLIFLTAVFVVCAALWFAMSTDTMRLLPGNQKTEHIAHLQFSDEQFAQVTIGNVQISAEVAHSKEKKRQGLSGREALPPNAGLLFVFDKPGAYSFWNKDMLFPIDILWIRDDAVVDVYEGLPPFQEKENFTVTPKAAADMVLEVNAGFVKEHNVRTGDKVEIQAL